MGSGLETKLRCDHSLANGFRLIVTAALTALLAASPAPALAQGFGLGQLLGGSGGGGGGGSGSGGLSQFFGGSGAGSRPQRSDRPDDSGISVERSAPPFTGKFTGTQASQGMQSSITAEFACYPASDADIPHARAFVCYAGGSNPGGPSSSGGPPNRGSDGQPGGRGSYSQPNEAQPNGPPVGIE